jgi:hypothetical protein
MKARINLQLFKNRTFDSGALGVLARVVHQFLSAVYYRVVIMQQDNPITEIDFNVDDSSELMQLNIDLAQAVRDSEVRPDVREYKSEKQIVQDVSPKGYVMFHASSGGGYSARVSNREHQLVFDSTKLEEGDFFAVSLLERGIYRMTNRINSTSGEIIVGIPPEAAYRTKTLDTRFIAVDEKGFDPNRIELSSAQGLVFRIKDSARISIEKTDTSPQKHDKPVIHWQKPKTANTK